VLAGTLDVRQLYCEKSVGDTNSSNGPKAVVRADVFDN